MAASAAAAGPLSVVATKKQEGGEVGRVVTPCRISYPLFTAEFMSLRGFQRMKIWRAVHILVILVCIDLHDANS